MIEPFLHDIFEFQDSEIPFNHFGFVWLGQGGFLFRSQSKSNICIDPYLSESVTRLKGLSRISPIPIDPGKLKIKYLIVTHNHLDHLDPDTIPKILHANKNVIVISLPDCAEALKLVGVNPKRLVLLQHGEHFVTSDLLIHSIPAIHLIPSSGYVLEFPEAKVYISGDTEYDKSLLVSHLKHIDLMFVCINGKLGNMNYEQAASLATEIQPKYVIPMHYGMFAENTVDPNLFIKALKKRSNRISCNVLEIAKPFLFARNQNNTKCSLEEN